MTVVPYAYTYIYTDYICMPFVHSKVLSTLYEKIEWQHKYVLNKIGIVYAPVESIIYRFEVCVHTFCGLGCNCKTSETNTYNNTTDKTITPQ